MRSPTRSVTRSANAGRMFQRYAPERHASFSVALALAGVMSKRLTKAEGRKTLRLRCTRFAGGFSMESGGV